VYEQLRLHWYAVIHSRMNSSLSPPPKKNPGSAYALGVPSWLPAWVITACDLYCCLLPQCEVLRTCHAGFPIATLSGTGRCTSICGAAMLLRCNWYRNLTAVNCILHWIVLTLSTLHTRNSSCITLWWLHHNHKMSISYHKNGLVSSHQTVRRWFIFMCFVVRMFWWN